MESQQSPSDRLSYTKLGDAVGVLLNSAAALAFPDYQQEHSQAAIRKTQMGTPIRSDLWLQIMLYFNVSFSFFWFFVMSGTFLYKVCRLSSEQLIFRPIL